MNDTNKQILEDTKRIIKSIVIPYSRGVSLRGLCEEYNEIEGKQLPYRELGFRTLTQFLNSMPDVVRMNGDHSIPGSITLFPVVDESTAHIVQMVAQQNNSGKRGAKRRIPRSSIWANRGPLINPYRSRPQINPNIFQRSLPRPPFSPRPVYNSKPPPSLLGAQSNPQIIASNLLLRQDLAQKPNNLNKVFENFSITIPNGSVNNYNNGLNLNNTSGLEAITRNTSEPISGQEFAQRSQSPFLPLDIKDNLRSIMTNRDFADGFMLYNFDAIYKSKFSQALDYRKYGFSSLADCLKSVPHLVGMIATGSSTFKLMPPEMGSSDSPKSQSNFGSNPTTTTVITTRNAMAVITTTSTMTSLTFVTTSNNTVTTTSITKHSTPICSTSNSTINSGRNRTLNIHIPKPYTDIVKSQTPVKQLSSLPTIPMSVQDNLRKYFLNIGSEEKILCHEFEDVYELFFNQSFDYKSFGFSSVAEALKSVPEIVESVPAILLKPSNGLRAYLLESEETLDTSSASHYTKAILSNGLAPVSKSPASDESDFPLSDPRLSPIGSRSSSEESLPIRFSPTSTPTCGIPTQAVDDFRHVLAQFPEGVIAVQFAAEYEKIFKRKFDSRVWGFHSPMELFCKLITIFAIEEKSFGESRLPETVLHDARYRRFDRPVIVEKTNQMDLLKLREIPDLIQARIMKLIELNMPTGLSVSLFMGEYNLNYGELELSKLRISDTSQLFKILESGLPIVVEMIDGHKRAFLKPKEEVEAFICLSTRQLRYAFARTMIDVPPNVVIPGDHFRNLEFNPTEEYIPVFITSSVNPHDIYLQLKGPNHHTALELLMQSLDFYDFAEEDEWRVPKGFICLGLPVIARFSGDRYWHRARVTRLQSNNDRVVTVTFVDYGGIMTSDIKDLRLMKREYIGLPMQALRCSLYGIKPILGADGWTAAARDKVLRFSKRNYSLACAFLDKVNDIHVVCLCDTNTETDVFLHNVMVADGHAVFEDGVLEMMEKNIENGILDTIVMNRTDSSIDLNHTNESLI